MRRYLGGERLPSPPLFFFSACWYLGSSWGRVRITQRLCGSRRLLTWWFFPKLWRKQWKEGRSLFCIFSSFLSLFLYVYLGFFYFFSSSFSLNIIFAFCSFCSLFLLHLLLFILLSVDGRGWIQCFVLGFFLRSPPLHPAVRD